MAGGLTEVTQDNWSAGAFQGPDPQRIPLDGFYAGTNGLLDADEGVIYRRGGGAYLSNDQGFALRRVWDFYLAAGARTIFAGNNNLYVLDANDLTATEIWPSIVFNEKPGVGNGIAWFPGQGSVWGYAGYRGYVGPAGYDTGTISITQGSVTVTGSGTAWLTNLYPGYLLVIGSPFRAVVAVQTVVSDTQITLAAPWDQPSVSGSPYWGGPLLALDLKNFDNMPGNTYATATNGRLVIAQGSQIIFGSLSEVPSFQNSPTTNLHQLPGGSQILGIDTLRDTIVVFADTGIYTISNIAFDLTDDLGNPQQRLDRLSGEIVLVDNNGISGYGHSLVVPATDDIYLIDAASSPVPISRSIRSLWRSYIKAGYTVGQAQVHRGHYVLPVMNGTEWVDTLVCRLDTGAWTQMANVTGQSVGYTQRIGSATRQPRLLAAYGNRVVDCSGWWTPTATNKNEADDSTHSFSVTTRDYTLGTLKAMVKKIRVWLEGVDAAADAPVLTASVATGLPGSTFTSLSGTAGASTGDAPAGVFSVNTGGKRVRFQFSSTDPWASLKIKALDLFVRPRGRQ